MTRPDQTRPDQPIVRNSSLELLRVVAMLMIVASHFSSHGNFDLSPSPLTWSKMWLLFMQMGQYGNVIFVLISGYFLTDSKGVKVNKVIDLWLKLVFYSVSLYILSVVWGSEDFSFKQILRSFMPITKYRWWFASTYIVLYLIHEWLNVLVRNLSRDEYKKLLVSIGLFWCIIPTLTNAPLEGMNIISFVCLYIIAGYIRLWRNDSGSGKYIALSVIFLAVSYIFNMLIALAASKYNSFEGKSMYFYGMHRPFVVLSSLCLFIGFKNMKMNYSRAINIIASATFGVYLIHNDNFFRNILWRDIFRNASFQYSPYLIPYSIAVILIVYISCTVIELIRSRIFKTLSRGRLS